MLFALLLACAPSDDVDTDAAPDDCDTVIAITHDATGQRCLDLEAQADCCPAGWDYLGHDGRQQTVCWTDACVGVALIEGECPDGWTSAGTDGLVQSACVEGSP